MYTVVPGILALDFDGVLCDGLPEYFQSAWETYCRVWQISERVPPDHLMSVFNDLRPIIETGAWEMPVLIRLLLLGTNEKELWEHWPHIAKEQLERDNLNAASIAAQLDSIREECLDKTPAQWLGQHTFYPGTVKFIQSVLQSSVQLAIITTKESRFTSELLKCQGIHLPNQWIFGKDCQRPKHQTLEKLLHVSPLIWFVEDRLKTLQQVKQHLPLADIKLYLAGWGYNTVADRDDCLRDPKIKLLSLSKFTQEFPDWI